VSERHVVKPSDYSATGTAGNPSRKKTVADLIRERMRCNECEAAMINGVFCHETGCPNSRKTWIEAREEWVLFVACFVCGFDVEVGEVCGCEVVEDCEESVVQS
jgi:hypothetical protein